MKKSLIAIFMGLTTLCAWSQNRGDMAAGLNIGVAPYVGSGNYSFTNFQLGLMYQYNLSDKVRLEADLDYGFKDKGIGVFDISANGQFLIKPTSRIVVYPFVGLGYANISAGGSGNSRFLFNVGLGGELRLTSFISVGLKANYQYIKDFCRLPIAVYATYNF